MCLVGHKALLSQLLTWELLMACLFGSTWLHARLEQAIEIARIQLLCVPRLMICML